MNKTEWRQTQYSFLSSILRYPSIIPLLREKFIINEERKRKKHVPLTRHVSRTNTDDLNRVTASRKKNLQRAEREDTRRRRGWIEKEDREEGEGEETREERLEKTGRF